MKSNQSEEFPEILSSRALLMEDIEKLGSGDKRSDMSIVDTIECCTTNEHLLAGDYIIATVKYQNKECIFVHGFPGDIATGAFFDENYNIFYEVGEPSLREGLDKNLLDNWYNSLENEEGKLPDFMWPPCKLI